MNPTSTPSALPSISNHPTGGPTVSSHPSISFEPSLTQQPSSSPTDECYDNWFDFATDVEDADDNSVFVVCPNTLLIPLDEYFDGFLIHEIFVYASNILLMCGRDGDLANNCTFSGPSISYLYFHEDYSINGAIVSGFTFDGANDTSVSIWSNADDLYSTSVTFRECRWLNNNGQDGGAVNVWQAEVHFENCTFEGNISPMGSGIFNDDGVVYVDHSTFENNAGNVRVQLYLCICTISFIVLSFIIVCRVGQLKLGGIIRLHISPNLVSFTTQVAFLWIMDHHLEIT